MDYLYVQVENPWYNYYVVDLDLFILFLVVYAKIREVCATCWYKNLKSRTTKWKTTVLTTQYVN